ncbi:transcription factor bHLH30 [Brachypodium distachyon]|uniref:BHLH domain-containing protein n=1 Tax=Brachypodium distachyon TaxID=15368 RepID=I1H791_BRADI|nr:transcription factor bHLH30 [Brachypodium distachyon]KQK22480.1 hypothetical protein BRADI_1g67500v3 [Brachypodium distachyon]|eukprot:XP_003558309.1 transcription factor bHLH30 [Brachypodium distachyon]
MGAHGDRRRHRREEVGVILDEEEEDLEQHEGACGGGATSGVLAAEEELGGGGCEEAGGAGMVFEASSSVGSASVTMGPPPIMCWPPPVPSSLSSQALHHYHNINNLGSGGGGQQGPFFPLLPPQPPPPPPFFADLYARRALQFAYDHHHHHSGGASSSSSDPLGLYMGMAGYGQYGGSPGAAGMMMPPPFGDFGRMTAQEIMDAKALAASKSHSEAERRRRERINAHLARLRSLLPNTTKTDKASLLAEVIQHVKELKRQTSEIREEAASACPCPLPTESDELTVDASSDEDGRLLVRASLCCDDRADLLPDLIRALKALRLRALKAEITTLGGRVKNVLLVTEDHSCDHQQQQQQDDGDEPMPMSPQHAVASIQEALRAVMERTASSAPAEDSGGSGSGGLKRQRTTSLSAILENRSI